MDFIARYREIVRFERSVARMFADLNVDPYSTTTEYRLVRLRALDAMREKFNVDFKAEFGVDDCETEAPDWLIE